MWFLYRLCSLSHTLLQRQVADKCAHLFTSPFSTIVLWAALASPSMANAPGPLQTLSFLFSFKGFSRMTQFFIWLNWSKTFKIELHDGRRHGWLKASLPTSAGRAAGTHASFLMLSPSVVLSTHLVKLLLSPFWWSETRFKCHGTRLNRFKMLGLSLFFLCLRLLSQWLGLARSLPSTMANPMSLKRSSARLVCPQQECQPSHCLFWHLSTLTGQSWHWADLCKNLNILTLELTHRNGRYSGFRSYRQFHVLICKTNRIGNLVTATGKLDLSNPLCKYQYNYPIPKNLYHYT